MEKSEICKRIPHAGCMCLLDSVEQWDDDHIVCYSQSHLDINNPLRKDDQLHAVSGIEYGGQAIALHGGLMQTEQLDGPRIGYIASLRDVKIHTDRLDKIDDALCVCADRIAAGQDSYVYQFKLSVSSKVLLTGKMTVILMAVVAE